MNYNEFPTVTQSPQLALRQEMADALMSPQADRGSLIEAEILVRQTEQANRVAGGN